MSKKFGLVLLNALRNIQRYGNNVNADCDECEADNPRNMAEDLGDLMRFGVHELVSRPIAWHFSAPKLLLRKKQQNWN